MVTTANELADQLRHWIASEVKNHGSTVAVRPGHREILHWPPHPVAWQFRVPHDSWTEHTTMRIGSEDFDVDIARWRDQFFGRCPALWHDANGETREEMLENLAAAAQPLLDRQFQIATCLGEPNRHVEPVRDLEPLSLLKLLYCPDRDVANEARIAIETHAASGLYCPSLIAILRDRSHPHRRSAQWCALDLFEDMNSFCTDEESVRDAADAIKGIIWEAEDDFARTTFKAGVVLGGHFPADVGGPVLLACLESPSKIGRRSSIHGLFHVVEWEPKMRNQVVAALQACADRETVPALKDFALSMVHDIAAGEEDHKEEPYFEEEL